MNAELLASSSTPIVTAPIVKVWKPWTIGGMTIIIGAVIRPEFGIAVGFALAVINWWRMHRRRTAIINLFMGVLLALATAAIHYYFERLTWVPDTAEYSLQLIASFFWIFLVAAYLHLTTERDLTHAKEQFNVRPASQWIAAGVVVATLLVALLAQKVVQASVAWAMVPPLQTTSHFIEEGASSIQGTVHPWANAPIANRHLVLCQLEETRYDPLAPYVCTLTRLTASTDQQGRFAIDNVPSGRYLVFYDSGLADFQSGVVKWADHRMPLKPYAGWVKVFNSFEHPPFMYPPPGTELNDFYYLYSQATLMLGGSPFVLAHDMHAASGYTNEIEPWRPLPSGVFIPTVIEVHDGQTSEVKFDVLKWQE